MGEKITREIDVYTIAPKEEYLSENVDGEVIDESEKIDDTVNQQQSENTGAQQNLQQQINNPFTFIQNGDNNTQIGYIANQTIVKK